MMTFEQLQQAIKRTYTVHARFGGYCSKKEKQNNIFPVIFALLLYNNLF